MATTIFDLPSELLYQIYDSLPTSTLKTLLYSHHFHSSAQSHIFYHSQFTLSLSDGTQCCKPGGISIASVGDLTPRFQWHILKFRNYKINLAITNFKSMLAQLAIHRSAIQELCNKPTKVNVKLIIHLSYSMNNFNDVKDSFLNIDKISKEFNHGGLNDVSVDLELLKHEVYDSENEMESSSGEE
ncbi:uncharacterized protein LODBEIA_P60150 [Lodderomyces beijingensis]|uniref:F-box domain-containing protein n=1 Tax=Lodderomyces beijingensis TaxID=1775926 RepID=A0ABP0ZW94_9ASCO